MNVRDGIVRVEGGEWPVGLPEGEREEERRREAGERRAEDGAG